MATLSNKHKAFIVIHLACFDTSNEVQEKFKEKYGFEVSPSQVSYYNPGTVQANEQLAQQWKDLFKETRSKFQGEISNIPIANQAYRLQKLQENFEQLQRIKNYKAANETIEQAAKETGGAYTNKLEHTGKDGGPIQVSEVEIVKNKNG